MRTTIALSMLAFLAYSLSANAQSGVPSDRQVPGTLLEPAAKGTIEDVAKELVAHGIPTAVIVRAEEREGRSTWRRRPEALDQRATDTATTTVGVFVSEFLRHHPEYGVRHDSPVLFLAPLRESPCMARLTKRGLPSTMSGSVFRVVSDALSVANDTQPGQPAARLFAGPGDGRPVGEPDYGEYVEVRLQDPSLAGVLSEIARLVPGLGWGVREQGGRKSPPHPDSACQVFLFTGRTQINVGKLAPTKPAAP